ncbi:hypothetical protein BJ912DRAFT_1055467 [Pholiota molesta]|nr:hypothetical protein BJ912DRAFT_1055467 [Pholiota molesta]
MQAVERRSYIVPPILDWIGRCAAGHTSGCKRTRDGVQLGCTGTSCTCPGVCMHAPRYLHTLAGRPRPCIAATGYLPTSSTKMGRVRAVRFVLVVVVVVVVFRIWDAVVFSQSLPPQLSRPSSRNMSA